MPATVRTLRTNETRPRRPSIAVWSDPSLLSVSEPNKARRRSSPQTSPLDEAAAGDETAVMLVDTDKAKKEATAALTDRLSCLNTKLLQRIASYLDFASTVQLAACSKTLESLVRNNAEILSTVDLSTRNKRITDDTIEMIVEDIVGPHVRSLSLSHCYYVTDRGLAIIAEQCPQLETLDLNSCWLITDASLSKLGQHCPRLTCINLSNCRKITDAGISSLLQLKASQPSLGLTELCLSYCKNITNRTMHALAEHSTKTLTLLNIQRCTKVTDDAFEGWAQTGVFTNLRELILTDCSFLSDKAIAMLIKAAPNLERLCINFCCALSDSAVEDLATLKRLRELDVSFCGAAVSDASVGVLLKERADTLEYLNIRGCMRVSGAGIMAAIEPAFLHTLNVSQCLGVSTQELSCLSGSAHIQNLVA